MKCKHCKAELEKGATACPSCGETVAKRKKFTLKTWHWAVIITVSVLALLAGSVAIWWAVADVESFSEGWTLIQNAFNEPDNDVYYKDSYTVSDEKAAKWREKVVAVVGDKELTNGELQVYYWSNIYDFLNNYGYYAAYLGLDYAKPLDEQSCPETEGTWQHFFLDDALSTWHNYQAMALVAEKEGMELSETLQGYLDTFRQNLAQSAVEGGYSSIDAMLQAQMGAGCTYDDYYSHMETYYKGYQYFEKKYDQTEAQVTTEDLEKWFAANEETLAESGITKESGNYYDVRHILILVEGGTEDADGNVVYSEEEWEACRSEAQKIYDEWLAGDQTEEHFATLANQYSEDNGSNTNGGLYENLTESLKNSTETASGLDENFVNWYVDESRAAGDHALVKTQYGYHVMYFLNSEAQWEAASWEGLMKEEASEIIKGATAQYPIAVDYKKIALGLVKLGASE